MGPPKAIRYVVHYIPRMISVLSESRRRGAPLTMSAAGGRIGRSVGDCWSLCEVRERPPSSIATGRNGSIFPVGRLLGAHGTHYIELRKYGMVTAPWTPPIANHRHSVMQCVRVDVACAVRILVKAREFAQALRVASG